MFDRVMQILCRCFCNWGEKKKIEVTVNRETLIVVVK